jgi:hypothetical protein
MPGRLLLLATLIAFFFAGSLVAQRYPERDHTVFHRPPVAQTKHQLPSGSSSRTHATTSAAANNSSHVAGPANGQGGSFTGQGANVKPGAASAPEGNEHPSQ